MREVQVGSNARIYSLDLHYSSGAAVVGAAVSIQTSSGEYSATSGNNGVASISIPNTVSLPNFVVATADNSNIQPEARAFPGNASTVQNETVICNSAPSRILVKERRLRHLGDNNYTGSENSQLQISTEGTSLSYSFSLASVPSSMPHIRLFARGVEEGTQLKINGITVDRLGDSSPDGDLSRYNFQLTANPSTVFRVGNNTFTLETGYRANIQDWDDIEYCSMILYYP